MFMVTAVGTAVIAKRNGSVTGVAVRPDATAISAEQLNDEVRRRRLIRLAEHGNLDLNKKETWEQIIGLRVGEAAAHVIAAFSKWLTSGNEGTFGNMKEWSIKYFSSVSEEVAKDSLYSVLANPEVSESVSSFTRSVTVNAGLIDLARINHLLQSPSFNVRRRGVQLLQYTKQSYSANDLPALQTTLSLLETAFPEQVERFSKKTMLSGKDRQMWRCACGAENTEDRQKCEGCGRDTHGFLQYDFTAAQAAATTQAQVEVLSDLLAS